MKLFRKVLGIYNRRGIIAPTVDAFHLGVTFFAYDDYVKSVLVMALSDLLYFAYVRTSRVDNFDASALRFDIKIFAYSVRPYNDLFA